MRYLATIAAASSALSIGGAAVAQPERPSVDSRCSDDRGVDRCAPDQHRRTLALFGVDAIESFRAPGTTVRRVFYVDGYGRDVIAISFIRRPERDPMMFVHFPRREGQPAPGPMEAQVPEPVWRELLAASEGFERDLEPSRGTPDLCMHSWVYTVEAADPPYGYAPARSARKTRDACGISLAQRFARLAYTQAVPLLPHCAVLDQANHRNAATLLQACGLLSGDRSAAAAALNAAAPLTRRLDADDLAGVRQAFAWEGTLDWAGTRSGGNGTAGRNWTERVSNARIDLSITRVHGLAADRVAMNGQLLRRLPGAEDTPNGYELAPVQFTWVFSGTQQWEIERATVGAFARAPLPGATRR